MPPVDVEERGPHEEWPSEASWSPAPVLKRRRDRRDRTGIVIAATFAAIAVAAIKPWGLGGPAPSAPEAVGPTGQLAPASAPVQPSPAPAIVDRNAMTCLTHQVEQVMTLERWPDREIKSWSQQDGRAVLISSSHVVGVGVCPGIGPVFPDPNGLTEVRDPLAWGTAVLVGVRQLIGGTAHNLGAPPRITEQTNYTAAGVLYGAPRSIEVPLPEASSGATGAPGRSGDATPLLLPAWPAGRFEISYFFPGDPFLAKRTVVLEISTPHNN